MLGSVTISSSSSMNEMLTGSKAGIGGVERDRLLVYRHRKAIQLAAQLIQIGGNEINQTRLAGLRFLKLRLHFGWYLLPGLERWDLAVG